MKKLILLLLLSVSISAAPVTNTYTLITVGTAHTLITNIDNLTAVAFHSQSSTQQNAVLQSPSISYGQGTYDLVSGTNITFSFVSSTNLKAWSWIEVTNFLCFQYSTNRDIGREKLFLLQNNSGTNQDISWNTSWHNLTVVDQPVVLTNGTSARFLFRVVGDDETNVFLEYTLGIN